MPDPPKAKGLTCPVCGGGRLLVYYTTKPAPGLRVRLRKCQCGARVKTRETIVSVTRGKPADPSLN